MPNGVQSPVVNIVTTVLSSVIFFKVLFGKSLNTKCLLCIQMYIPLYVMVAVRRRCPWGSKDFSFQLSPPNHTFLSSVTAMQYKRSLKYLLAGNLVSITDDTDGTSTTPLPVKQVLLFHFLAFFQCIQNEFSNDFHRFCNDEM